MTEIDDFYFKLKRADASEVWVHALVHKVKFQITKTGGTKIKASRFVAHGFEVDGNPPIGSDVVDDVIVGDQVGSEKHVYNATVSGLDVLAITTAIP